MTPLTRLGEYEINLGIRQHDRCSHVFTKISLPSPVANEVSVREKIEDRARFLCGIEDEGVPRCRHAVARSRKEDCSTKMTPLTRLGEYEINLGIRQHDRRSHIFTKISLPSPVANEVNVRRRSKIAHDFCAESRMRVFQDVATLWLVLGKRIVLQRCRR
jgi:hypothetical protein